MGYGNMTQKYLRILKKISPKLNIKFYTSRNVKNNLYKNIFGIKKFNGPHGKNVEIVLILILIHL